jgi:hypothetical protein
MPIPAPISAAPDLHADLAWLRRDAVSPAPDRRGHPAGLGRESLAPGDRLRAPRERPLPARPAPPSARSRRLWLPLGLAAAVAALALPHLPDPGGRAGFEAAADRPPVPQRAPPLIWQPLPQAQPLYALEGPAGIGPQAQAARGHAGGGREDTLALGGPGAPLQFRLSVTRGVADGAPSSFYVDLVRRAAEAGLPVERSAPPRPLATKFGTAEAARATLGGLACLGIRFRHPDLAFRLHGWLCGSEALAVDESHLACLLDGLVPAAGGEDPAMRVLFTQADAWRTGACALARWGAAS